MKYIFTQTAQHSMASTACSDLVNELPDLIRKHTDFDYTCVQTDKGYLLKPTFCKMPYRISFVPEIEVVVSHNDTRTDLYMRGYPVMLVRVFMAFWFAFFLVIEGSSLVFAVDTGLAGIIPIVVPIIMCVFVCFLCRLSTRAGFKSVVKAIQKELK